MLRFRCNTHKPYLCIDCGTPVGRRVMRCPVCAATALYNRPIYERTPEHRKLMSARTKGIPRNYPSASTRPEVAERIRQAWTPEMREAALKRGLANAKDPQWRERCGLPGDQNPMWENGRSQIPYSRGWARKVKQLAWERADHVCEVCGGKPLDTHHIDFHKDNHDLDNLQVLCRKCHKQLHVAHLKNKNRQG